MPSRPVRLTICAAFRMQDIGASNRDVEGERAASPPLPGIRGGVTMISVTGRTDHLQAALDRATDLNRDVLRP
jgi:hypothetical protein